MMSAPPAKPQVAAWQWCLPALQAACVLLLAAWLALGLPIGIPGQWAWLVHDHPVSVGALLRAVVICVVILLATAWGLLRIRRRRRSDVPVVASLLVLLFALQLAIASLAPQAGFFLIASTGSPVAVEYFTAAGAVDDPWVYCRTYAQTQRRGHHIATHPPGAVLTYWVLRGISQSPLFPAAAFEALIERVLYAPPELIASAARSYPGVRLSPAEVGSALFTNLAFGACAALSVVPLYWLASRARSRSSALIVCTLFALTPAPVLFFQGLDALVLLLTTTAMALGYHAIVAQRLGAAVLCGLMLGLLCAITFGALAALALVFAVALALIRFLPAPKRAKAWACVAAAAVAWIAVMSILHLLCGGKLHVIFAQAMAIHRELTWHKFGRGYPTWVGLNLVEFACFLGFPTTITVIAAALGLAKRGLHSSTRPEAIGIVGLLVLIVLNFSGNVRGEVGRVWMFLMPPLVLWAGDQLRRAPAWRRTRALIALSLTLGQLLLMGLRLTPVVLPY